jgi:photosystem II stability/assembly factor-like uncharacterized protein
VVATADGGRSWQRARFIADVEEFPRDVRFVTPAQGYVVVGPWPLVLLGTWDGGASWVQLYPPLAPTGSVQFLGADDGVGAGTMADPRAVLRTADGGRTWRQVGRVGDGEAGRVTALSFVDSRRGWAVAEEWDRAHARTLYRTADGGATWTAVATSRESKDLYFDVSFLDERTGYVASRYGHLFVTRDGGETFAPVDVADSRNSQMAFASELVGWKLADWELLATADGGRSWTPVPLGYRVGQFDLLPDGRAWVVAGDCTGTTCEPALLATADDGATWTRYDLGAVVPGVVAFADVEHGWLRDEQGRLFRTRDGGHGWEQLP